MPIPTVITDLSTTAASNYPSGGDSPIVLDDVQRAHASFIAQLRLGTVFATTALASMGAAALGANTDITSLQGTATNNNAATGKIGEYLESEILIGSAVAAVNAGTVTITTLNLGAGDWDVAGVAISSTAATTTSSVFISHLDTSASTYTMPNGGGTAFESTSKGANVSWLQNMRKRISLGAATTIYLRSRLDFATSTASLYGGIYARRVR